jgi:hypothetical protein
MPVSAADIKWKIFRVICYLQVAAALSILGLMVVLSWPFSFLSSLNSEGSAWIMGTFLTFAAIGANAFSNLYLLEKFLPDQHPPPAAFKLNLILYVLSIIAICLIVGVILYLRYEFAVYEQSVRLPTFPMGMLTILVVTAIPVWIFQPLLRNKLNKNARLVTDSFLDDEPLLNEEEL